MAIFEGTGDFAVSIHQSFGEGANDSGTARAVGANECDVLAATASKGIDNLLDDFGVVGHLKFSMSARVAFG